MRKQLIKSLRYNAVLDMMYMAKSGAISKRRIQVLQISEDSFHAYCFLRKSKRTFKSENILALVPVIRKESMVI